MFGTPEFMSPEQACGHPLDGRSDLYSLAATMFTMLTGGGLFEAGTPIEWLTHHARTPAPHLASVVPALARFPELDRALQRCLAKQRDERPRTAEELDQLLASLEGYVERGGGEVVASAPRPPAVRAPRLSPSSYIEALPRDTVASGATLLAPVAPPADLPATGTDAMIAAASGRGRYLALGGLLVLAVVGVAIGIAIRGRPARPAPAPGSGQVGHVVDARPIATTMPAVDDAGVEHAHADAAVVAAPEDATSTVAADPGRGPVRGPPRNAPANTVAQGHLAAAEAALRANNRLRQLAEADLARQADPKNVRAIYLLADALLKTGDLDRGCNYLRSLGRNRLALARARAAGCPPPAGAPAQGDPAP